MKRLTRFLLWLYPPAWRERYRDELEALIEDSAPGWRAIPDLLKEAIRMHLTTWSFAKLASVLGLAGLIAGALISGFIPPTYVSSAAMQITPPSGSTDLSPAAANQRQTARLMQMENDILSRTSLSGIINDPRLDLYASERESTPLEDVIERMRRQDLRIIHDSPSTFSISFRYPDRLKARQTVQMLITRFQDENLLRARADGDQARAGAYIGDRLQVLDPPTLPMAPPIPYLRADWRDLVPVPSWFKAVWLGLAIAALLAGAAKLFLTMWPFGLKTGIAGIAGLAAAALIFPLIPSAYVSQAALEMVPAEVPETRDASTINQVLTERLARMRSEILSRTYLSIVIQDPHLFLYSAARKTIPLEDVIERMRYEDLRIGIASAPGSLSPTLTVSFRYPDRYKAEQTVQAIMNRFLDADSVTQRFQEAARKSEPIPRFAGFNLDVLDPPSSPVQPAKPNRYVFGAFGVAAGVMLAAVARLLLRLRTVTAA